MRRAIGFLMLVIAVCPIFASCGKFSDDLYFAVTSGNLERVREAVDNGADVNKGSVLYALHENPLLYSINNSYPHIAKYLLSKGADPNYIDKRNGISLLMYTVGGHNEKGLTYSNASDYGLYQILLQDQRTDVNLTGKLGYTALDYACRDNGNLGIVNDLISHGAKITATTMQCTFEGYKRGFCEESVLKLVFDNLTEQHMPSALPPEIEAALRGDSSKLISLENGLTQENRQLALYLTCAYGDADALGALCDGTVNINEIRWPKTLLSVACTYGNMEAVKYLLDEQADVELRTDDDLPSSKPPLTYALQYNHLDIADYLFAHGAKLQIAKSGTRGYPDVLEMACGKGNLETIKWIVAHGYPLDEERAAKSMAEAARNDHIEVLEYFLADLKVDINSEYYYSTALATDSASIETIKYMVKNGADVNGGKKRISTPLDGAVRANRADIVQYLLDNGADADFVGTDNGYTPSRALTVAIQNGFFDIVKILVDHGADLAYHEGWASGKDTPLEIAKNRGSQNIIDYIQNALNEE